MHKSGIGTNHIDICNKILNIVKRQRFASDLFWVKVYSNCREQGFCIMGWTGRSEFHAAFSENRNSDDIVVYTEINDYPDKRKDGWDDQCRPSEEAYKTARYFALGDLERAAAHIVAMMREYEKRAKADEDARAKKKVA